MPLLGDREADHRKHGDSAVLDLDFAPEANRTFVAVLAEVGRVPEAQRRADPSQVSHVKGASRSGYCSVLCFGSGHRGLRRKPRLLDRVLIRL